MNEADVAVIGAGAAGLFAAIWARRTNPAARVIALDGAKRIGAKILISGGGRCNITHYHVDEAAFAGSSPAAIRKILKRFSVEQTVDFFGSLGVLFKQEPTGKLFPTSNRAQTVLGALLRAAEQDDVEIATSHRVDAVTRHGDSFYVQGDWGTLPARKVVLATGGKSVPKTGSDGHGYNIAVSLGHSLTERIYPALVPLLLDPKTPFHELSGISATVKVKVETASGRVQKSFENSMLFTHFGISGPAILDVSRYFIDAKQSEPGSVLTVHWLPEKTAEEINKEMQSIHRSTVASWLKKRFPDRLAHTLCMMGGVPGDTPGYRLTREQRSGLVQILTRTVLPVTGNRGFGYAEVTAGGVPLKELHLNTMESRRCPGLYLCGEICDVDGRIGGFNFQWAWSSGYVAGTAAASA